MPFFRKQAQPAESLPQSAHESAAPTPVTGCGAPSTGYQTTKYPEAPIYGRRVRLASAAASGTGHCPAAPGGLICGRRMRLASAAGCGALSTGYQTTKYPEAPIYGRRVRLASAAASGTGHCPAAAASGCRLSLPESATPTRDFQKLSGNPQNSGSPIYASRIRRLNPRQQVEPGTARRGEEGL